LFDPTIYDTEKFFHVYDVGSDDYTEVAVTNAPDLKNESSYSLPVFDCSGKTKKCDLVLPKRWTFYSILLSEKKHICA
jgi:hypothetical protein